VEGKISSIIVSLVTSVPENQNSHFRNFLI
jgi:hypothetical protein